jgi:hypothetical protein
LAVNVRLSTETLELCGERLSGKEKLADAGF